MFNKTKKLFKKSARSSSDEQLMDEASNLIHLQVQTAYSALAEVSKNRIPRVTIARGIQKMIEEVNEMLSPIGLTYKDLEAVQSVIDVEDERIKITLQRYKVLIESSDSVNPFCTFYEILDVVSQEEVEEKNELKALLDGAIITLFSHAEFPSTLLTNIDKKIKLVREDESTGAHLLHRKLKVFLRNFQQYKDCNKALKDCPVVDFRLKELKASIYFQELTESMLAGNAAVADKEVGLINQWTIYLSELSEEEQMGKYDLIQIIDRCSQVYNRQLGAA